MATKFEEVVDVFEENYTYNPYGSKTEGEWSGGYTSIDYLNSHFGKYGSADDMINSTNIEGLKLFFGWLADNGKIPK